MRGQLVDEIIKQGGRPETDVYRAPDCGEAETVTAVAYICSQLRRNKASVKPPEYEQAMYQRG